MPDPTTRRPCDSQAAADSDHLDLTSGSGRQTTPRLHFSLLRSEIMSHPKNIIFPAINKPVTRRLLLRNKTRTDLAVKLRTNSSALVMEPAQGFLRAGKTQSVSVRFDAVQSARGQSLQIFCRPVDKRTEPYCRRWFLMSDEDNLEESKNLLAQTLRIKTSTGFTPLVTVLDLPCNAIIVKAEQYPTYMADDSDTTTAHQIDSGTNTAYQISENELLAMLPPDGSLGTAQGINENSWGTPSMPTCAWIEKFFDMIFPPDDGGRKSAAPCGAGNGD